MYAKLKNNVLKRAPNKVQYNGNTIFNPPSDILSELGYLPVQYTDMPTDVPDGQHYESGWTQTDTAIVQVWTLADDPEETGQTTEERVTALEEQQEITDAALQDLILTMMGGE